VIRVKFHEVILVQETESKYELSAINNEIIRTVPSGGYVLKVSQVHPELGGISSREIHWGRDLLTLRVVAYIS